MASPAIRFSDRSLQWLLLAVLAIHSGEEILAVALFHFHIDLPFGELVSLLVSGTVAVLFVVALPGLGGLGLRVRDFLLAIVAAALIENALFQHVPRSLRAHGY